MHAEICHINLSRGYRGGERQTEVLIGALAARGWQQRAVVRKGGVLAGRLRDIAAVSVVEKPGNLVAAAIFGGESALLHVHQGRSLHIAGLQHLFRGRPYIVTRRVDNPVRNTPANRYLYRHTRCVITLTQAIAQVVNEFDPAINCEIIPDATADLTHDPQAAQRIRAKSGKQFLVGHVGALDDSSKGQLQLIAAARDLQVREPDIGFVLVGSGRDEALLRAAATGLDNLQFAGQVTNVGDYLAAFDLFAFPSRREGLGSSLLDAYQFALPVVAARAGGIPEIVTDGVNGALFELDDISAFSAALLRYRHDPELCATTGAANATKVKNYAPAVIAEHYERVYSQILAAEQHA